MYVLVEPRRRRARAGGVPQGHLGLRDDPIQPLVIRANQGDCVEIAYTNNASGGTYGMHIDGLAFDVGSSGDAVGQQRLRPCPAGASTHATATTCPTTSSSRARTTCAPARATARRSRTACSARSSVEPAGSTYLNADDGTPLRLRLGGDDRAGRRPRVPREREALPRDRQREDDAVPDDKTATRCRRSTRSHAALPPGLARDQLPLRAVHAPPRARGRQSRTPTAPTRSATRPRRSRGAIWPTRRSSASSTPARRCSTSSTCTAAASAGASTPVADTPSTTPRPASTRTRRGSRLEAPRLPVHRPGRVLQPRDRGRRRRRAAGRQASSSYHCHIAEHYVVGHVGLLARLQHASSPTSRPCRTAPRPPTRSIRPA